MLTAEQEDLKKRWVDALRSGKYKQGKGRLRKKRGDDVRFCCLGVLRNIEPLKKKHGDEFLDVWPFPEIRYLNRPTQNGLARMNDDGRTFNEIADWIEREIV